MDNQPEESPKIKTHEEILKLFKDVQSAEAKVKNPEEVTEDTIESKAFLHETEPPSQKPEEDSEEQQPVEPSGQLPPQYNEKQKRSFLHVTEKPEMQSERKKNWLSLLRKNTENQTELEPSTEGEQQADEMILHHSTFILQLDTDGNLVGFPMKKPHLEHSKKGGLFSRQKTQSEGGEPEETAKGIKGALTHLVSTFRRKSSKGFEPSGGIGDKIKGIFRRKTKE